MKKLPILDELNNLTNKIVEIVGNADSVEVEEEIIDSVEDLLIMAYVFGNESAAEDLGIESDIDINKMNTTIFKDVAGKTWTERIAEYLQNGGTVAEINRVIDTETMRVFNDSKFQLAQDSGIQNIKKTWVTMNDDRVRDSHWILEGVTIPLNDRFYTLDGDSALQPYGFEKADNNINCRCALEFST